MDLYELKVGFAELELVFLLLRLFRLFQKDFLYNLMRHAALKAVYLAVVL